MRPDPNEAEQLAEVAFEAHQQAQYFHRLASWDRAMTRAFKGILSAPERRRFLDKALERSR